MEGGGGRRGRLKGAPPSTSPTPSTRRGRHERAQTHSLRGGQRRGRGADPGRARRASPGQRGGGGGRRRRGPRLSLPARRLRSPRSREPGGGAAGPQDAEGGRAG